ncbi:MAG TPA: hypothetical protein VNA25_02065 [Phycisphaerae bacterium]|nr:hypothetical protein [Phycisphaerae bacterium]
MRRADFVKALALVPFAPAVLEERPGYAADVLPKLKGKQDLRICGEEGDVWHSKLGWIRPPKEF